ncbi:MAG TPA: M1 family metallopeptidase, partial [Chloroflexi bacterium]|nr:M1 family metallopeptidase [Chloroflexota bacterium]
MKKHCLILLIGIFLLLAGCGSPTVEPIFQATQKSTDEHTEVLLTLEVVSTPESIPTPDEQLFSLPEPPENPTHYKLDLIFNYYSHFGSVTQKITYTNKSNQAMPEILLVVPPRNFEGSYSQYSLSGDLITAFREEGIFTYLSLSKPLQPMETTVINLSFRIYLPEHPGIYGYTNQQANVSDWYPFIPPYDDEQGWLAYPRIVDQDNIIVGESIVNEFSNFEVSLTLTSHADLIEVAASAPATGADGRYTYTLEHARGFTFSISDSYFIHEIVQDDVTIRSYVFMNEIESGKSVTKIGANAMKLFG